MKPTPFNNQRPANLDQINKKMHANEERSRQEALAKAQRVRGYKQHPSGLTDPICLELEKSLHHYQVIMLRLGLNGCQKHTFVEAGEKLNLTREQVRVREQDALVNLMRKFKLTIAQVRQRLEIVYCPY
jgi:DNA-directed RNA polymerase sigma subunit (sigma70/sigma32)